MNDINLEKISIVHWYPELEKHKCGYCKTENSAVSFGMWAEQLSVDDYQTLIDRGWRRSGMYCYKAIMDQTCCPLYTVRCKAVDFSPSKSHKKIIKRFNKFVNDGIIPLDKNTNTDNAHGDVSYECETRIIKERPNLQMDLSSIKKSPEQIIEQSSIASTIDRVENCAEPQSSSLAATQLTSTSKPASYKPGLGADPTRPPCKKAKLLRLEKRQQKLLERGMPVDKRAGNETKTLEQFLNEIPETAKYNLKIDLVVASSLKTHAFEEIKLIEFELYKKYQMSIHNDPPDKCTVIGFTRFLITSPLKTVRVRGHNSGVVTYGTFHQQYWLDDKLIAVAVLDILPRSVSSVYFFYDPDYKFLTLGTYGALREIHFVQSLQKIVPTIEFYNMGFYIHSCPKMRYKAQFNHSFLLCPETYKWFPLEKCIPILEVDKYSRLNDDIDAIDENDCSSKDIDNIKICTYSNFMLFGNYKNKHGEQDIFNNIGKLIGKKCAGTLLFVSAQH